MEKEKHDFEQYEPQSIAQRIGKVLLVILATLFVLVIILVMLGPRIGDIFVHQEMLRFSTAPGTVEQTNKVFRSGGKVNIPGLFAHEGSSTIFDLRVETFLNREIWTTVDFAYLEINGKPATEVLFLNGGYPVSGDDPDDASYEFHYSLPSYEEGIIEIRVLDGFSEMTDIEMHMRFWYETWVPCLCL